MNDLNIGHDEFLTCVLRDGVAVLTLELGAFDISQDLGVRDRFFALLSEIEQMESVKALLVINSAAYPDVDRQRTFLDTLIHGTGKSMTEMDRLLSVVAHTRYQILEKLIGYRKLVVTAVQGEIASPFFGLSLGISVRLAADDTVLRFSRADFGFPPSWPLCLYLPRYVGQGRAAEMLLSGKPLRAAKLVEFGLVHQVLPTERFEDRCIERTIELCRLPGSQISGINQMLSPDPSDISNSFDASMDLMKKVLHTARSGEWGGMAPAHCR